LKELHELKAAVVGTGFIGAVHADSLRRLGVEILGVAGSTPEGARAASPATVYDSYEAVLADDRVDVVQPLAVSSDQSAELVELAARSGLVHRTNVDLRFYPLVQEARERERAGELGEIWNVHGGYLQDWFALPTVWNWRLTSRMCSATPLPCRTASAAGST